MKKRKCRSVGAVALILLLSTTGSLALVKSNEKEPLSRGPELEVTTDKTVYEIGELVTIFFTNIGDETLCGGGPIVTIYNNEEEIVYQEATYCYWEIEPGEYKEWLPWDQTNKHGNQVPVGKYTVEGFLSGGEDNYVDTATFYILDYEPPGPPYGPTLGVVNISYTFCIDIPNEDEYDLCYLVWDFGDGYITDPVGPYAAGETVCIDHLWSEPGDYEIKVGIKDSYGLWYWTDPLLVHIGDNSPPSKPHIDGPHIHCRPICGKAGEEYEYTFKSVDPDGDDIYYLVDWGDGTYDDWFGPYPSGEEATANHTWNAQGTYTIKAKSKDINGLESDWGTLTVTMPRTRAINSFFLQFLEKLFEKFPLLEWLLLNIR